MKSAGKARNNGLYRHIRTSKEIIRHLLNDYYKNKSLTTAVRLSKSLYVFYLIISNMVAMSSVAIATFDFSIRMFPPVIM